MKTSGSGETASRVVAGWVVRFASWCVPGYRRREWLEEWQAELAALEASRVSGVDGLPGALGFAAGALPHAVWTRMEGWTMDSVIQDVRYSARVLRRSPGFTIVAALTLALGIGANGAIFSLVNGLVLRAPAGVEAPDRLVQIARSYESEPRWDNFSWPAMQLIAEEARTLSGVAGYQSQAFVIGRGDEVERVPGQHVTGSYFGVLGVSPRVGRLIQPADDVERGAHPVIVLSHGLWSRRYGSDPDVVGQTLHVGNEPYEIIGVTPEGFGGVESVGVAPTVFVPVMMQPGFGGQSPFEAWGASWINLVGRLADGVDFVAAEASMEVVSVRLRGAAAVNDDIEVLLAEGVGLDPEGRATARQMSFILLLIVGLVLLLACTNVANLFLSRATARRTEVGVRMALGAGRSRLIRQLVTESSLVAVFATLLALPIVLLAADLIPFVFPLALSVSLEPDVRVYGLLVGVGLTAGLLFGAAPAWATSRRDVTGALREGTSTGPRSRTRLRDSLVIAQLGLSLGLVAGAALLGRSVLNARNADPGFQPRGVVAGYVGLFATGRYDDESGIAFFESLVAEASQLPGVRHATVANQLPIAGGHSRATVRPLGRDDVAFEAEYIVVGPDYFETLEIPIVRGRPLGGPADEPEPVVVVNEALASLFWPSEDPIGKELDGNPALRVVGLVPDVQMRSLRASGNPAVYYPMGHFYTSAMYLHVASESGRPIEAERLRAAVSGLDPELPVTNVVDLHAAVIDSMGETRTIGYLVGAFAMLALLLAAVGLYGLVSYGAAQRVRELGIRIALGAHPDSLVKLILARGLAVAMLGIGLGFAVSYGLGSALQSLLFGVAHTDLLTMVGAALVLLTAAGVAAWLPARRASRVDAALSLRE